MMTNVEITFRVHSRGTVKQEKMQTQLDSDTLRDLSMESNKKKDGKYAGWMKNFFPSAEWVEISQVRRL